jgi:hypothetical protein
MFLLFLKAQYTSRLAAVPKQELQLEHNAGEVSPLFQRFGKSGSYIKGLHIEIKSAIFSLKKFDLTLLSIHLKPTEGDIFIYEIYF